MLPSSPVPMLVEMLWAIWVLNCWAMSCVASDCPGTAEAVLCAPPAGVA